MCTDGIVLNVGRSLQCELIKKKYEGKNTLKARNNTSENQMKLERKRNESMI